ncbi:LAME_0H03312g1_1 [Lachancea meyersii CBS 8951]|uniref:LAME_0H03312g1_1 n=1 Tax=Lachancea meyersii CBS 8951 TaxID=1266667 RepID=A0A1G4KDQ1_9SACH|nr:LAME_0H03312g1_1 [Lachancea meyersii CBS 8951]
MKLLSSVSQLFCSSVTLVTALVSSETTVSCGTVATGGFLETTPYSSSTASILARGTPAIGVYHFYRSITYVSDCNPSTRTAADVNPTITIY